MNLNRAFKTVLLDLIKVANPQTGVTENDVVVGVLAPNTNVNFNKNTVVEVSANPNSNAYEGSTNLYYNRLNLDDVITSVANGETFEVLAAATGNAPAVVVEAVADEISTRYGIACDANDFVVSLSNIDSGTYELVAAPDSKWFIGTSVIELLLASVPPSPPIDIDSDLPNKNLDGLDFTPPAP